MMVVNDVLISDEVVQEHFICDLDACKGACCWEGDFVGLYVDDIEEYGQFMGYFDFSRAKASLSNQLDCKIPKLTQSGKIQLRNLVHPVLYIHHT